LPDRIGPTAPAARRLATGVVGALLTLGLTACGGSDHADHEAASETAATVATDSAQTLPSQPGDSAQTSASAGEQSAGEQEASAGEQAAQPVTVTSVDFEFRVDEGSFSAGTYEITLVNDGDATHDLVVERDGEDVAATEAIDPGRTTTLTVSLEPGEYVLYCSVGNHRAMGMETPISVS
jgi:plastocyanin